VFGDESLKAAEDEAIDPGRFGMTEALFLQKAID
jgi:hypothetical protein